MTIIQRLNPDTVDDILNYDITEYLEEGSDEGWNLSPGIYNTSIYIYYWEEFNGETHEYESELRIKNTKKIMLSSRTIYINDI